MPEDEQGYFFSTVSYPLISLTCSRSYVCNPHIGLFLRHKSCPILSLHDRQSHVTLFCVSTLCYDASVAVLSLVIVVCITAEYIHRLLRHQPKASCERTQAYVLEYIWTVVGDTSVYLHSQYSSTHFCR
jgi:hypothetical protein